ncbi:NAD(+) synthase [Christensenellaceae bacterium OttesenSCG-928-L17]|nr:NAD(+) synthase [Christensenellaceae bacterium OttesenSCG-928-L17]
MRDILHSSETEGIVYGNSGGKDSALVGILCKAACENTVGILMPCGSKRNYETDMRDAQALAEHFQINARCVDLSSIKAELVNSIAEVSGMTESACANIAPRLRMATLYAIATAENRLVAGTGNRSEGYMGYFTKWGDGAYDFNPIADLTVTEVYEFLRFLGAPEFIMKKAPSAGLFDGQTDESEMGITYRKIDEYLLDGTAGQRDMRIIETFHGKSVHKRQMPILYGSANWRNNTGNKA